MKRVVACLLRLSVAVVAAAGLFVLAGPALADATPGAVYTETNTVLDNFVKVFARAADGTLSDAGQVSTGGSGSLISPPLGFPVTDSQGAVTLSNDGRLLFAVNAGSNTISSFRVGPQGIVLADQVSSNGLFPNSVTINRSGVLYVLNVVSDNIAGFTVSRAGEMTPIPGSIRSTSPGSAPAQVGFNPSGDVLAVTERVTNQIDTWLVAQDGTPSASPVVSASTGNVPFGFAFTQRSQLVVTNADIPLSSASSYAVDRATGALAPIDVKPSLTASACWAVITNDNRYVYTSSPLDQAIAAYRINPDGSLVLIDPHAGETTGLGLDEALSHNSKFLYVESPTGFSFASSDINVFAVNSDGSLTFIDSAHGLPGGSSGLAAW